ncbi:MAG TPA: hypothetical protein VNW92_07135, partial [Polyangiaceae bacterium]|nr:hypothetical protein [Polyangiaceae bacterium]
GSIQGGAFGLHDGTSAISARTTTLPRSHIVFRPRLERALSNSDRADDRVMALGNEHNMGKIQRPAAGLVAVAPRIFLVG